MLPISGCKDRLIRRTLRRVYRFCHFCPCGKRVYPLGKRNSVSQTAGKRTVHAPCTRIVDKKVFFDHLTQLPMI